MKPSELAIIKQKSPKATIILANKLLKNNAVRELEESGALSYIAFVDQDQQSYDVKVSIDEAKNLLTYSCDCKTNDELCEHAMAVYFAIIKKVKKNAKLKIVPKKKVEDEIRPLLSLKTASKDRSRLMPAPEAPNLDDLDLEEYIQKKQSFTDDKEVLHWRRNFLNTLIRKRKLSHKYTLFLIELFIYEKDYDELIELVDDLTSFELIIKHFDIMYASNKIQLLKNILSKSNTVLYEKRKMYYSDKTYIDRMHQLVLKKYTKEEIKVVIQSLKFLFRSSELRFKIEQQLFPKDTAV